MIQINICIYIYIAPHFFRKDRVGEYVNQIMNLEIISNHVWVHDFLDCGDVLFKYILYLYRTYLFLKRKHCIILMRFSSSLTYPLCFISLEQNNVFESIWVSFSVCKLQLFLVKLFYEVRDARHLIRRN